MEISCSLMWLAFIVLLIEERLYNASSILIQVQLLILPEQLNLQYSIPNLAIWVKFQIVFNKDFWTFQFCSFVILLLLYLSSQHARCPLNLATSMCL